MIAKVAVLSCLFSLTCASGWYNHGYSPLSYASSIGYGHGGYSTYLSPSYTVPIVPKAVYAQPITKAVVPSYTYAPYAPAVSTVSRYQVHSSPVIKSYAVAPVVKPYVAAPIKPYVTPVSSYSSYSSGYPLVVGQGYHSGFSNGFTSDYFGGHSGYGYGGYGSKYVW